VTIEGLHFPGQNLDAASGALAQQPGLVVVDRHVVGQLQTPQEFHAIEHGQALARVEDEGDAGLVELAGVLQHALAAVGGHDAQGDAAGIGDLVLVGMVHGARMEGGDLVVGQVGGDEGLGGEGPRNLRGYGSGPCRTGSAGPGRAASSPTVAMITGSPPSSFMVVGDVAGAAAEFPAHVRHQEGHVQDVDLVGQDVVLEVVVEHHDGVVGDGAADQGTHGRFFSEIGQE
jgi:hypothetical protein